MASAIQPNSRTTTGRVEKAAAAAAKIQTVDAVNRYLKMCIYGRNKVGKTYFAGSSGRKTLIIDCQEKGSETLVGTSNVDVYLADTWDEIPWIYWHLKANQHDYEIVAIDTVTMLSSMCLRWIMGAESREVGSDPLMPDRRHYGKLNMALGQMIIDWRNLPMHVLFLAQERVDTAEDETDEAATLIEVVPSLTKGPRSTLMSAVGTIGRLYLREVTIKDKKTGKAVTEVQRRMLIGSHSRFAAGTRIKGLPRVLVNPNLADILEHRDKYGEVPVGESNPETSEDLN